MRDKLQIIALSLLGLAIPLTTYSKGYFFIAIVLAAVLGVFSLNFKQLKHSFSFFNKKLLMLVVPVCLVTVLSVIFAIDFSYSLKKLADVSLILVITGLLGMFLQNVKKERFLISLKAMLIMTVINIAYLYFDMYFASPEILLSIYGEGETGPGRVRYPASQIAVISPLLFAYIYFTLKNKTYAWGFFILVFFTVFATGGRSAMLSFIVGGLFMIVLLFIYKHEKINLKKIVVGVCAVLLCVSGGLLGYKVLDARNGGKEFEYRASLESSDLSSGRFEIWKFTWQKSLENPVLGVGIGGYRKLTADSDVVLAARNHPHNFILEILVSTGFVGLITCLTVLFIGFLMYFKQINQISMVAIGVVSSYVTYWVNSLTSVSILQTYWLAIFAVMSLI
ncbi:MAG TPA: hypothetical protein DCL21_01165, partial [Alphaproteobacteria bacterium]|nr:hypothetical protein [Alphaproteobacteria bacterium]